MDQKGYSWSEYSSSSVEKHDENEVLTAVNNLFLLDEKEVVR